MCLKNLSLLCVLGINQCWEEKEGTFGSCYILPAHVLPQVTIGLLCLLTLLFVNQCQDKLTEKSLE